MSAELAIETRRLAEPVLRLFRTAFGRLPDPGTLRLFAEQQRNGASFRDLAAVIVGSREFLTVHGPDPWADRHYIIRLFGFAFERKPDADVLATMIEQAAGDSDRVDMLVRIADALSGHRGYLANTLFADGMRPEDDLAYQFWLEQHGRIEEQDLIAIDQHIDRMASRPLFSLLLTATTVRPDLILETIAALERQDYPTWELCIGCPADMPATVAACLERAAGHVPGIRLVPAPAGAEMPELLQLALAASTGQFVGMLESSDRLAETALYEVAAALELKPELVVIYTDEDSLDGAGARFGALFKPGWGPDMLLAGDCIGQLVMVRRDRIDAVGGLRGDAGLFTRYDLLLRVTDKLPPNWILHIPAVLFHRGRAPGRALPFPQVAATRLHPELRRILDRHIARTDDKTIVGDFVLAGGVWPRASFARPAPPPLVSILISSHEQPELLERCIDGLLLRTDYTPVEILIADHNNRSLAARKLLRRLERHAAIRILPVEDPFNWSAFNNRLADAARGDILVLMNDDVDVIATDWLDELVAQLARPNVGIAGACLLYSDGSIQHGGMVLAERSAKHILRASRQDAGYLGQLAMARDMSAVTGACLAIHRKVLAAVGGLNEALPLSCNDIDLCLKVRHAGLRVVWSPFALLHHVDGATRGHDMTISQQALFRRSLASMQSRWFEEMRHDPYLNANLDATDHHLLLSDKPRRILPWQRMQTGEPGAAAC